MSLSRCNIQALTLPFSTHHSPSLRSDYLNTMDENNGKSTILENNDERLYYYGYSILRQLIYFVRPHIFIPGLAGFFYRPGYGSASSLGSG